MPRGLGSAAGCTAEEGRVYYSNNGSRGWLVLFGRTLLLALCCSQFFFSAAGGVISHSSRIFPLCTVWVEFPWLPWVADCGKVWDAKQPKHTHGRIAAASLLLAQSRLPQAGLVPRVPCCNCVYCGAVYPSQQKPGRLARAFHLQLGKLLPIFDLANQKNWHTHSTSSTLFWAAQLMIGCSKSNVNIRSNNKTGRFEAGKNTRACQRGASKEDARSAGHPPNKGKTITVHSWCQTVRELVHDGLSCVDSTPFPLLCRCIYLSYSAKIAMLAW